MHDNNTAEPLDEAITRLNGLLAGTYWQIEHSDPLFHEWRIAVPLPKGVTHPGATARTEYYWVEANGHNLADLVSTAANMVAEALAMRGVA